MRHAPVDRLLAAAAIVAFVLALAPALAPWALSGHSAALDLQREEAYHRAVLGGDLLRLRERGRAPLLPRRHPVERGGRGICEEILRGTVTVISP